MGQTETSDDCHCPNRVGWVEFQKFFHPLKSEIFWLHTEKDRQFIEQLHADHSKKQRVDILPTKLASRALLDEGFKRFGIGNRDSMGKLLEWLAGSFTPEAIPPGVGHIRYRTGERAPTKQVCSQIPCQGDSKLPDGDRFTPPRRTVT